jgi:hypothetical protein
MDLLVAASAAIAVGLALSVTLPCRHVIRAPDHLKQGQ